MNFADTMPSPFPNSFYGYKYLGSMIDSKLTWTPDTLNHNDGNYVIVTQTNQHWHCSI